MVTRGRVREMIFSSHASPQAAQHIPCVIQNSSFQRIETNGFRVDRGEDIVAAVSISHTGTCASFARKQVGVTGGAEGSKGEGVDG